MTDYGQILEDAREEKEAEEKKKRERCSLNKNTLHLIKHAKAFKKVLKAAEDEGFCLDEVIAVAKELE